MRRREFIAGLGGAATWTLTASAQQSSKVYRVACVSAPEPVADMNESSGDRGYRAFIEELRWLGYVEGRNLNLERYSGDGRTEHYGELANDVVRTKPDLIFTVADIVSPIKSATVTIPIVVITGDPLVLGLATSLAHPGGSITRVTPALPKGFGDCQPSFFARISATDPTLRCDSIRTSLLQDNFR